MTNYDGERESIETLLDKFESESDKDAKQEIYNKIYGTLAESGSFIDAFLLASLETETKKEYGYTLSKPKIDYDEMQKRRDQLESYYKNDNNPYPICGGN